MFFVFNVQFHVSLLEKSVSKVMVDRDCSPAMRWFFLRCFSNLERDPQYHGMFYDR